MAPLSFLSGSKFRSRRAKPLSSDNSNPFRTVTRQDVGIKLDVTPRISADDTIQLDIFQEVSSISTDLSSGTDDFVTNLRQITTSVLADDGEIIVIGGLIEQGDETITSKVPDCGRYPSRWQPLQVGRDELRPDQSDGLHSPNHRS